MAKEQEIVAANEPFLAKPLVGTLFSVLSGLSFLFVGMILPLVGKAGSATTYARQNAMAFIAAVTVSLVMGVLATISKFERRKIDGSPKPLFSMVLTLLSGLLLIAFFLGLLKI